MSIAVETALICGDIYFLINKHEEYPAAVYIRFPFIFFTFLNWLGIATLMLILWGKGNCVGEGSCFPCIHVSETGVPESSQSASKPLLSMI
jgi:hypothetical protein